MIFIKKCAIIKTVVFFETKDIKNKLKGGSKLFSNSTFKRDEDIIFGNFRKESSWSKKAETFKLDASKKQKTIVTNALKEDVAKNLLQHYGLPINEKTFESMTKAFSEEIEKETDYLFSQYGERDIIYVSKRSRLSPSLARSATELSRSIFLASEKCSMPVREFLFAYKGGCFTPPEVLQEWSGMSEERQKAAYEEIIMLLMRRTLNRKFEKEAEKDPYEKHRLLAMSS